MAIVRSCLNAVVVAIAVTGIVGCGTVLAQKPAPRAPAATKELEIAREYVFAACLMRRFPDSELAKEADAWASGLVENGNLPAEAYPKLAEIGRTKAPAPLMSSARVPLRFQSCLTLYNSPELPQLLRPILRKH
jgi:hypothetical protein